MASLFSSTLSLDANISASLSSSWTSKQSRSSFMCDAALFFVAAHCFTELMPREAFRSLFWNLAVHSLNFNAFESINAFHLLHCSLLSQTQLIFQSFYPKQRTNLFN